MKNPEHFSVKESIEFSKEIRKLSIEMVHKARASHIGGALSMADILSVLYNGILNINPDLPDNPGRDRFLLSKGHSCTSLYATLALKGFFPLQELNTYAQDGSLFLSHTNHLIPGVEISAGSLGQALSISCGLALAAKCKNKNWKTYCLLSDGELDEGSNWEPILLAPQLELDNLIVIVDYNKIQSLGHTKEVINLEPLKDKFIAFRWEVFEIDGHNHNQLFETLKEVQNQNNKPKVIIAHTIKGKGVDFMENRLKWHYKSPDDIQFKSAIQQINNQE